MFKKFLIICFTLFFLFPNVVLSNNQKIAYIDIDFIIKNSNIGKDVLKKISDFDKKNIEILAQHNKELKEQEINLKNRENIISKVAFEDEVKQLQKKIKSYNEKKNKMVLDLNEFKNKELNIIFTKIGPILEKHMKEKSIDIIINSKNIVIANPELDITKIILISVNEKL